ncbi:GATA transcription factor 5-like [Cornus florida]|uniref:GATA transcription factor 5-like n=1 Tax=Cornus florida TaxID=4283 RepID=UPI00289BA6E8|nr:GATA transcription factor 5-like [Cornus florida]
MDFCRNVSVSGGLPSKYPPEQVLSPSCSELGSLDDLLSGHNTEGDVSLEWLSIFMEDCLSSSGNCLPPTVPHTNLQNTTTTTTTLKPSQHLELDKMVPPLTNTSSMQKFVIPGKARSKRKRGGPAPKTTPLTSWSQHLNHPKDQTTPRMTTSSHPLLLQQAYWLADSELILPKNEDSSSKEEEEEVVVPQEQEEMVVVVGKGSSLEGSIGQGQGQGQQPRRCTHCLAQRTPQWRAGPLGPKTLCNACGVRYKSGRLLPEYRPAKSPTFVSYKHSNSHKKVMEMRMSQQ